MTVDQQVTRIVAEVLGIPQAELEEATAIREWLQMAVINDETCLALNINISTQTASQCRTFGEYFAVVRQAYAAA